MRDGRRGVRKRERGGGGRREGGTKRDREGKRKRSRQKETQRDRETLRETCRDVCWLLKVPATCECISDNFTCCHTEIEVADQTFHLTQSQYTDIRPTRPSTDPITPGAWQGSHWSASF